MHAGWAEFALNYQRAARVLRPLAFASVILGARQGRGRKP